MARSSLEARNYRAALAYAGAVLELDAGHAEAGRIRDEARTAIARFDEAIEEARRHLANGDVQATARSLEVARAVDSSAPSVSEISERLANLVRDREAAARADTERQTSRAASSPRATGQPRLPSPEAPPPAGLPSPALPPPAPSTTQPAEARPSPVPPPVSEPPPVPANPPAAKPEPPPTPPAPSVAVPAPPPPVETRPPETSKPAPSADDRDDASIRRLVTTYGRAIEGKDLALFRIGQAEPDG